jgi:two-component system LytT family sensor kinase
MCFVPLRQQNQTHINMYKHVNEKFKTEAARLEFWIVTAFIVIAFILNAIDIIRAGGHSSISGNTTVNGVITDSYSYIGSPLTEVLFNSLVVYVCYLLLCFYVSPAFESLGDKASNTIYIFALIAVCFIISIITVNFAALLAIKILIIYFNRNKQNKTNALYYEVALLTASWMLIMLCLFYARSIYIKYYALYTLPMVLAVYLYAVHRLLPKVSSFKHPFLSYFWRMFLTAIITSLALLAICFSLNDGNNNAFSGHFLEEAVNRVKSLTILLGGMEEETIAIITFGNFFTQLLIVIPLASSIYKKRDARKDEEIMSLKTELGQSDANLNFLKSQINPHFLFNALNTLYGTALQENADRTGEGIQKLGDMMRFMLQENTQDQILLSRDIDYVRNYISLQKLRTSTSGSITIETQIADYAGELMIAPMLLIPFVENAFKHGISLVNPSHIKVTLQTKDNTLYFDVHNSIHIRSDNDPEKGQSGIGLENVKQRLNLLYPDRHELIIRENATEFFIHITLKLGTND